MAKLSFRSPNKIFILLLVCYAIVISALGIYLKQAGVLDNEPLKLSDYVAATIAIATVFTATVAILLSYQNLDFTRRAEEGQLYIKMMERYSSNEMVQHLQLLGTFRQQNKHQLPDAIRQWSTDLTNGEADAIKLEQARHRVKYFYRDLMQLYQAGYFSKELTKRILNTGGRYLFSDLVLPMEKFRNPLSFDSEYHPFFDLHQEIINSQKLTTPNKPRTICLIPARYDATRYPGKLMMPLGHQTVIRHTYSNVSSMNIFDRVAVVTNSEVIRSEIADHGGDVLFFPTEHQSGTDRIAEAIRDMDFDIIINVQGDEPFVRKQPLLDLIDSLSDVSADDLKVASLMRLMDNEEHIKSSNFVKVVTDKNLNALYFSRSVVPYQQTRAKAEYFEHIGVYAFTRSALIMFASLKPTPLELVESVECLRFLENGIPIRMVKTDYLILEIDTEEDRLLAEKLLKEGKDLVD